MATGREMPEAIEVAVFAKAPIPGFAKTRLVPLLGPEGAASLQAFLTRRALTTAVEAAIGPVTLWCAPDTSHPSFQGAARRLGLALAAQPKGDLGERMLAAFLAAPAAGGLVLIGTDCPCLSPRDLHDAAAALRGGADVVVAEAEDGGYGLIAARRPLPALFEDVPWGTDRVAAITAARAAAAGLRLAKLRAIWDVDTPMDYRRLLDSDLLGSGARTVLGKLSQPSLLQPGNINKPT